MSASETVPEGSTVSRASLWAELFLWLVPEPPRDEDALRALAVTAAVGALMCAIGPLYAGLIWWLAPPPPVYYALAAVTFLACAFALLLLRHRRQRTAAWLLLVAGTVSVTVPFLREGAGTPAASNFVIVLVMAALLVGWRGVLVLGVPFTLLVVGVQLAESHGLFHPQRDHSSRGVFVMMQLVTLTVMLVVSNRALLGASARRKRLELQLLQAQRMEAIGRLAGGVAHDFNNLLTVILANATLLERAQPASGREELAGIRSAANRGAELTKQLLLLSRKEGLQPTVLDLRVVILDLERLLRPVMPDGVRMEFEPPRDPVLILADPSQISQVIMNLAINARDAMPDGGVLRFAVEVCAVNEAQGAGRRVRLTVSDTGTGMDAATVEHVFEPFFTTKPEGIGTGLGLFTVQGIVTQSGGTVRVQSQPGIGSSFEVSLPLASADFRAPVPAASAAAP
ncbi:MAG TPA: ATP-binding protein [Polyangiaceae bacterium]|nr:ATP-binding protein [Polyangiaceae bacterium]